MFPLPPWPTSGRFYLAHVVMQNDVSMREIALATGFSIAFLQQLVLGRRKPSYEHARILEHAIGCELEEFLFGPDGRRGGAKGEDKSKGKVKRKAKARPNGRAKNKSRLNRARGAASTE